MMAVSSISTNLTECSVKYQLFPELANTSFRDSSLETSDNFVIKYITELAPFLHKYIWQNEPFNLSLHDSKEDIEVYLEGSTNFGDNIEDEWFIVFLLYHLTLKDPNLIAKIEDSDGEFLLIEAADYLPKWVNPETSENRVYLYQGSLHLIPVATSPADVTSAPGGTPSIPQALAAIRRHPQVTKASQDIQDAILNRIKSYPEKILELQHRAHCYVPCNLAALLTHSPALVAPAVAAFYHRDPMDLKACRAMKYFPPETRVMTEVTFTRCLYAQLVQQNFEPDRRTGWKLPNSTSPSHLSHSLGMKLACGFEILACRATMKNSSSIFNDSVSSVESDLKHDNRWKALVTSLANNGYFKGELEGSLLYKELLQNASQFYVQSVQAQSSQTSDSAHIGSQILNQLKSIEVDYEHFKSAEKNLKPPDNDSWLNLTPDLLDSILEEYSKRTGLGDSSVEGANEKELAETITGTLKDFMGGTSELDGIDPDTCKRPNQRNKMKHSNNNHRIEFDADGFTDAVKSILYFKVPDSDSLSSSSMSGYSDEDEEINVTANIESKEEELTQRPERPPRKKDRKAKSESSATTISEMKNYMAQMDREVASTDVGQSFERIIPANDDKSDQLNDSIDEESDDFRPVDIDLTALKNILESFNSECGLPGPASTLFQSMGLSLPNDSDKL